MPATYAEPPAADAVGRLARFPWPAPQRQIGRARPANDLAPERSAGCVAKDGRYRLFGASHQPVVGCSHFARYGDTARLSCLDAKPVPSSGRAIIPTDFEDMLGYNNGPRATPLVDGPSVYTFGAEGMLQCVRVADGHMLWRIDTTKQFNVVKNFFGVGSSPLVWGDLLLVNVGGSPPGGPTDVYAANGKVQPDGSAIVAFDKITGAVRWKTGDDLASYSSPVAAKIAGRDVVFMFARGGLLAIDPEKRRNARPVFPGGHGSLKA